MLKRKPGWLAVSRSAAIAAAGLGAVAACASGAPAPTVALAPAAAQNAAAPFHSTPAALGRKVGKVRSYQNNNFQGVELKNGGFFVLTNEADAARVDAFGNVLYEFDVAALAAAYPDLRNKKVVEIAQDEGSDSNVLYLLLVPDQAIDSIRPADEADPYGYDEMIRDPGKQATVVRISESVYASDAGAWAPGFSVDGAINVNPQAMVRNYPASWLNSPFFFSKEDHPAWYVNAKQRVSDSVDANAAAQPALSASMVLPWKQYVTGLANMVARDGNVYVFGGNGSMFHDPEALSIGMWKLNFNLGKNECAGIPYAHLLKGLKYSRSEFPANIGQLIDLANVNERWDQSYAPIGQTEAFSYVPRIAVGGVQTNARGGAVTYFYLAGAITVGQVQNSQRRLAAAGSKAPSTLMARRSLQLSGPNAVSDPRINDANSIDPALLFATAFSADGLDRLPLANLDRRPDLFARVFAFPGWFDVGATMGSASSLPAYFYFDNKRYDTSEAGEDLRSGHERYYLNLSIIYHTNPQFAQPTNNSGRHNRFQADDARNYAVGEIFKHGNNHANVSYSYNLSLMIENAANYYYPTLSFGYSLKSVGGLTKVRMPKDPGNDSGGGAFAYGYAMQVGSSVLYLNEPSADYRDLAYHGPSTVSVAGRQKTGAPKFNGMDYPYSSIKLTETAANGYLAQIDFSGALEYRDTSPARYVGVPIYVLSIKDYNETVEQIASQFKISADPYAADPAGSAAKKDPQMPWDGFVGLQVSKSGTDVAALWGGAGEEFRSTDRPALSEYYGDRLWTDQLFYGFSADGTKVNQYNNNGWHGPKRIWFEIQGQNLTSFSYFDSSTFSVPWAVGVSETGLGETTYYAQRDADQRTDYQLTSLFHARVQYDNDNATFFGQAAGADGTAGEGVFYRNVGLGQDGVRRYATAPSPDRGTYLGAGDFLPDASADLKRSNLNDILFTPDADAALDQTDFKSAQLLRPELIGQVFQVTQRPKIESAQPPLGEVVLKADGVNAAVGTVRFTAYSWNALTQSYDLMPDSSGSGYRMNSSAFAGFSPYLGLGGGINSANWWIPFVIAFCVVSAVCASVAGAAALANKNAKAAAARKRAFAGVYPSRVAPAAPPKPIAAAGPKPVLAPIRKGKQPPVAAAAKPIKPMATGSNAKNPMPAIRQANRPPKPAKMVSFKPKKPLKPIKSQPK